MDACLVSGEAGTITAQQLPLNCYTEHNLILVNAASEIWTLAVVHNLAQIVAVSAVHFQIWRIQKQRVIGGFVVGVIDLNIPLLSTLVLLYYLLICVVVTNHFVEARGELLRGGALTGLLGRGLPRSHRCSGRKWPRLSVRRLLSYLSTVVRGLGRIKSGIHNSRD